MPTQRPFFSKWPMSTTAWPSARLNVRNLIATVTAGRETDHCIFVHTQRNGKCPVPRSPAAGSSGCPPSPPTLWYSHPVGEATGTHIVAI